MAQYSGPNLTQLVNDPAYGRPAPLGVGAGDPAAQHFISVNTPQGNTLDRFNQQQGALYNMGFAGNRAAQADIEAARQYAAQANQGGAYANQMAQFGGAMAGGVGQLSGGLAALGNRVAGQFAGNIPYADQALRNAFDPQRDIYRQYLADVTDQANAQQALRGVANTPYGAAVTGDTLGRFNTAWNAQQIQNQNVGAQTATTLQQQRLAAQLGGGGLIKQAGELGLGAGQLGLGAGQLGLGAGELGLKQGQLRLGAAQQVLAGYGLQEDAMKSALGELTKIFGMQNVDIKR